MNEKLTKRKADFTRYLDEELAEKPLKWWQQKTNRYMATRDMHSGKIDTSPGPVETVIKYDLKRALIESALFLCISFGFFILTGASKQITASWWFWAALVLFAPLFPLLWSSKRGVLILFNKQGFQTKTMPELTCWQHLVASYIRIDNSGETTSNYLLLYYYDESKDEIVKMEYNIDGLNMKKEDIALHLEFWKMMNGTDVIRT